MYQLKSAKKFACNLTKKKNGTFKIIEWKKPTFELKKDVIRQFNFGDIDFIVPELISVRRLNKSLVSTIKAKDGKVRYGFVSTDWTLWYLTQMRDHNLVHLITNNAKFTNGFSVGSGNFGPPCTDYAKHPDYSARCITTYLDNEDNFFFA